MVPRISGSGEVDAEVDNLRLEKLDSICFPDLPAAWRLVSDALEVVITRDGMGVTATDRRTGRRWEPATGTSFVMPSWRAMSAEKHGDDISSYAAAGFGAVSGHTGSFRPAGYGT